jgi:hypothetical protein
MDRNVKHIKFLFWYALSDLCKRMIVGQLLDIALAKTEPTSNDRLT